MARKLEKHPIFPYVAWSVIIGFALFVVYFTLAAAHNIEKLDASRVEQQAAWENVDS